MDINMVSKIRVSMLTTNIYLLQIYLQSHLQKLPVPQNSLKKGGSKISNITVAILLFYQVTHY